MTPDTKIDWYLCQIVALGMFKMFKSLWREPRAPEARGPTLRDWVLVVVVMTLAVVEGVYSDDVTWRAFSIAVTAALALTLPWRRMHPLAMVALAFGTTALVQTVAIVLASPWQGLDSNSVMLLLPYALLRWGAGREVVFGLAVIIVSFVTAVSVVLLSWQEVVVGGGVILLFPAAVGATMRYRDTAQRRAREQLRSGERERLARDLHDTVAHHVSAIAIQAQAGRALAATRPDAPLVALEVIESAASRALTEMRIIVRALRDETHLQCPASADDESYPQRLSRSDPRMPTSEMLSPNQTIADIQRLAQDPTLVLKVDVNYRGALSDLNSSIASTLYRLSREALTNVVRHAPDAQHVRIDILGDDGQVVLRIVDDGKVVSSPSVHGFGLRGMAERVALLGGSFRAGPAEHRGWCIEAVLPRHGAPS